jgi:type I restriction enzyme S subunit
MSLAKLGIKDESIRLFTVRELIEKDWLYKPLDGNHGEIHPKSEDFVASGVPFVMASDIVNGRIDYTQCSHITRKQADSLRKGFAHNGDVLLTHKATIGRTAIVSYAEQPYIMLTPQVTYYRVNNSREINNKYLRYFFDFQFFQDTIQLWAGAGSTRAYLGITEQQKLPVLLPKIERQEKIASILSAYDDLIESNRRRIGLLEQMAEELYREWFVRFRFPGYQQVKFEKTVPQGWEPRTLGDLCDLIKRGITPKYSDDSSRLVINQRCIRNGGVDLSSARQHDTKVPAEKIIQHADILINSTGVGTLGRVSVIEFEPDNLTCDTHVTICRANPNKVNPHFLACTVARLQQHFENLAVGSTGQTELGRDEIAKVKILLPPEDLQTEFAKRISSFWMIKIVLTDTLKNLAEQRDQLLTRLISGKLLVDQLDIQFPPSMREADAARQEVAHA